MSFEDILNILGNETRREILQMLSHSPCYVSQLSEELNIGQKAIIQHLELMRAAGILQSRNEKVEKGRPRKYYTISRDLVIEVNMGSSLFDIEIDSPHIDESVLDSFPKLKNISIELEKTSNLIGGERILKLDDIYKRLANERENINQVKKAIDYLMGEIREEIREEAREEELKRMLL
ncbi:MAG: ArsR/SmtB family transcription factor [Candidatus Hydrothermarchaeales archaeon]